MPGRAALKIAPRQDICIFCALRFGRPPQPLRRHVSDQFRAYRTSTHSDRPPAAAYAIAEDEPDESPQSFQQPSSPPSKPSPGAWPTFVPKKLVPKIVEAATRHPEGEAEEPSNWECAGCGNVNFARRNVCVSCRRSKFEPARKAPLPKSFEPATRSPLEKPVLAQSSHWKCSSCGNVNLARRERCMTCQEQKPSDSLSRKAPIPNPLPKFSTSPGQKDQIQQSMSRLSHLPGQRDQMQKSEPKWGNFLGQNDQAQNSQPRRGDFLSQKDQVREPRQKWGAFLGGNEGSEGERRSEGEQRQQSLDFGRSILVADRERPLWRRPGYNSRDGRGETLLDQSQGQTDSSSFPARPNQGERFLDTDQRDQSLFRKIEQLDRRDTQPAAGAPFNPARQFFRSGEDRVNRIGSVDTGDRSGMEALLSLTTDTNKPISRPRNFAGTGLPRQGLRAKDPASRGRRGVFDATNSSQMSESSNIPEDVVPKISTIMPEPFLIEGEKDGFRSRRDRPKLRFQESEEEGPRARGRFQANLEEPQVAETKLDPRPERKGARRGSSRSTGYDMEDPDEELLSRGRDRKKKKSRAKSKEIPPTRTAVQLPDFISVENLATALRVRTEDFITRMEEMGFERPRHDHVLDADTSGLIASEFNFEPTYSQESQVHDLVARPIPEDVSSLPARPPIVTIMGHVDHGKTTILDWLRKSSVVESEHGGITQHIGAFSVTMPGGKQITFLDTPGHAAFLDMRRRGANVTDIVILVVAADDSVKPQTLEAIKHATDAKVPIIVAMNKVDKEDANVDRVKQDLARHGVTVEDYGGEVQSIPVSGKFGKGMEELEEATVTLSELLDHRAEVDGPVEGWIIESKVTTAGRVATILVRRGTLRPGNIIVAGTTWARVRTLRNDAGVLVDKAPPGTPVQIDGWRADDPIAGWQVLQAEDEDHAKDVVDLRQEREEFAKLAGDTAKINAIRAEEAEARAKTLAWEAEQEWARKRASRRPKDNAGWVEGKASSGPKQVHFVVKADVSGSVEAVVNSVSAIGNNEVAANVIRSGVGVINESDVQHLASSGELGYLISFNQPVDASVARLASAAGVSILDHNIIYKVTDIVKEKLSAELPPAITQRVVGEAEIGKVFEISVKKGKAKIAGCKISNGVITRDKKIRVLRGAKVLYDGTLDSLKNVKKDVTEMRKGSECGMGFENWDDFREGDQVQCYEEQKTARTL